MCYFRVCDPIAYNFNVEATFDDGSCIYPEPCDFNLVSLILNDTYGDGWNSNYLTISGSNYSIPDANGNYTTNNYDIYDGGFSQETFLCIDLSSCIDIIYNNAGTYQEENSWSLVYDGVELIQAGPEGASVGDCNIAGCTDPEALNFDVNAVEDDGTCEYFACEDYENLVLVSLQTDPFPEETSWDLTTYDGTILYSISGLDEANFLYR